jgi:N-carbamoylputrescine amidase
MAKIKVAATQLAISWDLSANLQKAKETIESAAAQGANIILLQELFATPYFCKEQNPKYMEFAQPAENNSLLNELSELAKNLNVVLPISFYERAGNSFFNSLVTIDADGSLGELYRKSHIPDGPGYREKFYFSPGDTGFKVWDTQFGTIGAAICWDQWFPEAARAMTLAGAEILFYPTAIGSEPQDPELDSRDHWQRVMQGHAAANLVPVVASNRVGTETDDGTEITFYGSSFITDETGKILAQADRQNESILIAELDLDASRTARRSWGLFRDRRPELYAPLQRLAP